MDPKPKTLNLEPQTYWKSAAFPTENYIGNRGARLVVLYNRIGIISLECRM